MIKRNTLMDELVSYIHKNLRKGYTKESLHWALINQGYSKLEVEKALKRADMELARKAPPLKTPPEIKYELVEPEEYASTKIIEAKPFWKRLLGI